MNLDPNATYELTKVGSKNNNSTYFTHGEKLRGRAYEFGPFLVVGTVRTSPVEKVTVQGDGAFLIETRNTIYTLERVN